MNLDPMSPDTQRVIYLVDDDDAMRDALSKLLRTAGLRVEAFDSAMAFLKRHRSLVRTGVILLDVRMPGMSGLELQDVLAERGVALPIIFISGHGDIPMAIETVKKGAIDFVVKPFDDYELLCKVVDALDRVAGRGSATGGDAQARIGQLTVREREVLDRLLEGKPSRMIAEELFIAVKTVEFHRARIKEKLGVASNAELFRLCLGAPASQQRNP